MTILSQFNYQDVAEFKSDFILIMNMTSEIDREFGPIDPSFSHNLPEYKECLELFSKKYREIILKPNTNPADRNLSIFLDRPLKEIFDIARSIETLEAVGKDSLSKVGVKSENFEQALRAISKKVYLGYYTPGKSKSIILKFNEEEKMPELIYDKKGIIDDKSPEFKLCAYYGCLDGFNKQINIKKASSGFYKTGRGLVTRGAFLR